MKSRPSRCFAVVLFLSSFYTTALTVRADTPINIVPFTINVPGRYFLSANLSSNSTSKNAITVDADDVTIDFQDHTLSGLGAGQGTNANGVSATNHRNITIKNGTITGFKIAVLLQRGINSSPNNNAQNIVEDMRLASNTFGGIMVDNGIACRIEECLISRTGGTYTGIDVFGINLQFSSVLVRNNQISTALAVVGSTFGILSNNSNAVLVGNQIDTVINGITVLGNTGETKFQNTLIVNVPHPFNGGTDAGHND